MAEAGPSNPQKLPGYDFFQKVLGSPKYIVAPMVDQSELVRASQTISANSDNLWRQAWRRLSRKYGAQLVYTPMIHAKMFAEGERKPYRNEAFNIPKGEEGGPGDRPLIVQFCANDPDWLLQAARIVAPHCDAVDINLGCPQDIARRGHYGSFLQDEWETIYNLINNLHKNLSIPVTAKFRVFPTVEKTVQYAKMLESAGAQVLTCHGRIREQRGHHSGLADWEKIRAVKESVTVPVIANGNLLFHSDIENCLAATGADAVMSAEGNLYNPAIFCSAASALTFAPDDPSAPSNWVIASDTGLHLPHTVLALEYLAIVNSLETWTSPSAVKGHLFKLLRPAMSRETDLREQLGRVRFTKGKEKEAYAKYEDIVRKMDERMKRDARAVVDRPIEELITIDPETGVKVLPHWVAQPYTRPLLDINGKKVNNLKVSQVADALEPAEACGAKRAVSERTPEPEVNHKRPKLAEESAGFSIPLPA
ncbi:dihydrouridine synthase-domain-containing protein [Cytidiella melzeri]|nr:dihydrouridine synthase-domain-containing protein [Cytidiella melzeri]